MDENNQGEVLCSVKMQAGAGPGPLLWIGYIIVIHQELPKVKKMKHGLKQSPNTICNMHSISIERTHISLTFSS